MAMAAEPGVASMRIGQEDHGAAQILGRFSSSTARDRGRLVALEPEVAHLGLGHELEKRCRACPAQSGKDTATTWAASRRTVVCWRSISTVVSASGRSRIAKPAREKADPAWELQPNTSLDQCPTGTQRSQDIVQRADPDKHPDSIEVPSCVHRRRRENRADPEEARPRSRHAGEPEMIPQGRSLVLAPEQPAALQFRDHEIDEIGERPGK